MVVYKRVLLLTAVVMLVVVMAACSSKLPQSAASPGDEASSVPALPGVAAVSTASGTVAATATDPAAAGAATPTAGSATAPKLGAGASTNSARAASPVASDAVSSAAATTPAAAPQAKQTPSSAAASTASHVVPRTDKLVMIDPGHQRVGNNEPEQVGPDTRETKAKVSSGTVGVRTKKPEYVLNLEVSMLLKAELVRRGINVVMTRETHDVDISNKQRADMANEAGAALVVRIHADGDSSASTKGFSVLYPSLTQEAVKPIAAVSKQAAGYLLEGLQQTTGVKGRGLSARDDLSGFNWSKVPVALVEIGFMTNPEEDELMSVAAYQQKLAVGMADGIEQFLSVK